MIQIYPQSHISEYITDYYVNSSDYKGSKLFFYDDVATYNYCIIKKNTNDSLWYVITNGKLKGYLQDGLYNYQFDFDKYVSFDNNKPFQTNSSAIDFRIQGDCSSQMYIMFSTGNIIQDNITINKFTLLDDGRVLVNDKSDIENFDCDYYLKVNFWNRENGNIYNYPIQNTVEKNSYFPITIYGDYDAYVILKDGDGNIIKRMDFENGNQYDYATEFIWIPENCESIDIFEYNSNGYNEILNGVQPNLLNDSKYPLFQHSANGSYMTATPRQDAINNEPYYRYQPITGKIVSIFGALYDYYQSNEDYKALYVVSFDVRVQTDLQTAEIASYIHTDYFDSVSVNTTVEPYTWTRCYTKPFSLPLVDDGNGLGYLIINNNTVDAIEKWVDVKNVKIEKVKFDKYVNYIPKYVTSNSYGFANDRFYLEAGKTYTLRIIGSNTNATLGRHLFAEINDFSSFYASITTTDTPDAFNKKITFVAPLTKSYQINSYYYPQNVDTSGSVYLEAYYLYEGLIDPGEDITPTDYIPSTYDMESQTNYKSFSKSTVCPGYISNDYFYLDNNGVMDKLSCKANGFNVQTSEKEYVTLGRKQYNNKTTIKNQVIQNTGYNLNERQVYSLMKSPLVYKVEPRNKIKYFNYVSNTSQTYTINDANWIQLPLVYQLEIGKTYYLQGEIVDNDPSNLFTIGLNNGDNNTSMISLALNSSFVCTAQMSLRSHLSFANQIGYSPLVIRNLMITEGTTPRTFETFQAPFFDIKNYVIENTSFDGYEHRQINEKNIELTLTEQEQLIKRNNIKTNFFE